MREDITIRVMQIRADRNHKRRGYTNDLPTLCLGLCEEVGEMAKAINILGPHYKLRPGKNPDSLEHELADAMVYLLAIANAAGIDLNDLMVDKLVYRDPTPAAS